MSPTPPDPPPGAPEPALPPGHAPAPDPAALEALERFAAAGEKLWALPRGWEASGEPLIELIVAAGLAAWPHARALLAEADRLRGRNVELRQEVAALRSQAEGGRELARAFLEAWREVYEDWDDPGIARFRIAAIAPVRKLALGLILRPVAERGDAGGGPAPDEPPATDAPSGRTWEGSGPARLRVGRWLATVAESARGWVAAVAADGDSASLNGMVHATEAAAMRWAEAELARVGALDPAPAEDRSARYVAIDYTNYQGSRSIRVVEPRAIRWGSNEWHPEPQWLLDAWDVAKGAERTFAVKDIHQWRPAGAGEGQP